MGTRYRIFRSSGETNKTFYILEVDPMEQLIQETAVSLEKEGQDEKECYSAWDRIKVTFFLRLLKAEKYPCRIDIDFGCVRGDLITCLVICSHIDNLNCLQSIALLLQYKQQCEKERNNSSISNDGKAKLCLESFS